MRWNYDSTSSYFMYFYFILQIVHYNLSTFLTVIIYNGYKNNLISPEPSLAVTRGKLFPLEIVSKLSARSNNTKSKIVFYIHSRGAELEIGRLWHQLCSWRQFQHLGTVSQHRQSFISTSSYLHIHQRTFPHFLTASIRDFVKYLSLKIELFHF